MLDNWPWWSCLGLNPEKYQNNLGKDTNEKQADMALASIIKADEEFQLLVSVVQLDIEQSEDGVVK